MSLVEILAVHQPRPDDPRLLGNSVNFPEPGASIEAYSIPIKGWVVGRRSRAVRVDVIHERMPLLSIPVAQRRPDVMKQNPQLPADQPCGYTSSLSMVGLPRQFDLRLQAVFEDGQRMQLAVVQVRRTTLAPAAPSGIRPLLVTTLGRTGSTWLLHLLGQHPAIIAFGTFRYEPRVAGCWAAIFRRLAAPQSYRFQLRPDLADRYWWLGESNDSALPPITETTVEEWLGRDHVEDLATFCRSRVEGLYRQVSLSEQRASPSFFAEKTWPDATLVPTIYELFGGAKELLLVRDFRDMVCSIAAFNTKRGAVSFGRQSASSDEEHVRNLRTGAMRMLEDWHSRSDRAHVVRYEDLIESPETTVKAILSYLDLESSDSVIRGMLEAASRQAADVQRSHQTSADTASSIGRWKHDLPPELAEVCRDAFGDALNAFGYEDQDSVRRPIRPPDIAARIRLLLEGAIPRGAAVAVACDEESRRIDMNGRPTRPFVCRCFDQDAKDGVGPETLAAADWDRLRQMEVSYLVVPASQFGWLNENPEFRRRLEYDARLVAAKDDTCLAYELA